MWTAARRDLAAFFSGIEGAEQTALGNGVLGITGGPTADFNMALLGESRDDIEVFEEFVERMTSKGVQGMVMLSSAAGRHVGPIAATRGLTRAGSAPLMARSAAIDLGAQSSNFTIECVTDAAGMAVVADLVAAAFGMDRTWCARTFASPALLEVRGAEFFVAWRGEDAMSAVTTTGTDATIGIWSMATPPDKQRQGAGRAVLQSAMESRRRRGATTFYLCATGAGKPLYDSLGFKTVDELPIWVVGHSEQFAGH